MGEIGETLREQRIREKIDVQQVEEATKIRSKYLRALENEEFDLLPGAAYVKSFLRTYADFLGLDGRQLVDDYRRDYEHDDPLDQPIFPSRTGAGRGASDRPHWWRIALVLAVIVVIALVAVGLLAGDDAGAATFAVSLGAKTGV